MSEIQEYLNREIRRLIKEEKFEYESVEERADSPPEVKEAIERFRGMDPEERDTNILLCPASECDYTTESNTGLAVHWGRKNDEAHPGKLKNHYDVDTSRPDKFSKKVSEGQKRRWEETSEERKFKIIEKVASKNRGKKLTEEHKDKLSRSLSGSNNPMYGKNVPKEVREKISKSLRQWFQENGTEHCKRNFNKETRKAISQSVKDHWNQLSEKRKSEILRQRAKSMKKVWEEKSDEKLQQWRENIAEGVIDANAHGSDYNTYEVEGLDHVVRSSWEEEIAFILKSIGVEYTYEPVYELETGRYKPDFEVPDKNLVIEVKGFADDQSIEKAKQFRKISDKKYIVIGDRDPCDNHISYENENVEQKLTSIIYG